MNVAKTMILKWIYSMNKMDRIINEGIQKNLQIVPIGNKMKIKLYKMFQSCVTKTNDRTMWFILKVG